MREPRICVVGSSNIDLLAKIPRLPKMGETLVGDSFHMDCGGKGANQAVMAAKLGAQVTMVTKLGRDPLGEIIFENYRKMGIDTRYICYDSERSSGVAPILVNPQGQNVIVIVPGANDHLSPEDARRAREAIQGAEVVVGQLEVPVETTTEAFRIAREGGALTVFNPAPSRPLPEELLSLSDVVAPNETETEDITGLPVDSLRQAEAAGVRLRDLGARTAIITLGERGVMLADHAALTHVPAVPVSAVDTTGAGDAFIGSLAYFLAQGRPLRDAVQRANAVAAVSVTRVGAQASFPGRSEVEHLLKQSANDVQNPTTFSS